MNTSSMLRKPGWAKELRRNKSEDDIPDQITIIKKGNGSIPQPIHAGNGEMSMRGGSRYTGDGADDVLQPGKVAGDVHEGETVFSANATQAFPPDVLQALNQQAETGTLDIPKIRQALNLPAQQGYATGSFGKPILYPRRDSSTAVDENQTVAPRTANVITANPTPEPVIQPIVVPKTEPTVAKTIETPRTANVITTNPTPEPVIQPIAIPKQEEKKANVITTEQPITQPAITQIKVPTKTTETTTTPITPPAPSKYQTTYDTSLTRLQDVAGGNSEIDRNIANRNLRIYDTGAATDIAVADQQAALQNNVPESARAALGAEARSSVRSGRSELIGELSQSEQERALSANQAAAGLAMQGMQFEEDKNRYKDSADWKAYETAITAGDFNTAAAAYKRITGNDISMDQMKTNQEYLNKKQQQDITTGDLTIQSLTTRVGAEKVSAISAAIGSGMSLAQINAQYPDAKLTADEFKSMYEATPLGERTWERDMSYAKTLLEAGGSSNITAAAGMFNKAFPGTNIDFSKLITADNAATVNQGMSQLSDLVASGMDYDSAIAVMKKNGTLDMLGMSETEVESVYRGMKVNAIDEQWKEIVNSDFYKGLTPEQQSDMKAFQTAVLTGELDYSVQKEYTYTDASGKTVTKTFATEADAASFATQNKVKLTATGKSTVVPRTTTTTDETDSDTATPPSGRTEPLGTTIVDNGKIYQVIADGKTQEIKPTVNDPWSDDNSLILKAGEKDNQYYKTIIDERFKEVTDDGKIFTDKTGASIVNLKENENIANLSFDDPLIQKLKTAIEEETKKFPVDEHHANVYMTLVKDGNSWKWTTVPR